MESVNFVRYGVRSGNSNKTMSSIKSFFYIRFFADGEFYSFPDRSMMKAFHTVVHIVLID